MRYPRDENDKISPAEPAVARLSMLAPLGRTALGALQVAWKHHFSSSAGADLIVEGQQIAHPLLILEGWAARIRVLEDGRRQLLSLFLPGDLIGNCRHPHPVAVSTITALTHLRCCAAPAVDTFPDLAEAYAISGALEEAYLLAQIMRLGRLTAYERICDLLLELHERLSLSGLTQDGRFYLPLTQEILADICGLTSVHINRTLQRLRSNGDVIWKSRQVTLINQDRLAARIGRRPIRVCVKGQNRRSCGVLTRQPDPDLVLDIAD